MRDKVLTIMESWLDMFGTRLHGENNIDIRHIHRINNKNMFYSTY